MPPRAILLFHVFVGATRSAGSEDRDPCDEKGNAACKGIFDGSSTTARAIDAEHFTNRQKDNLGGVRSVGAKAVTLRRRNLLQSS